MKFLILSVLVAVAASLMRPAEAHDDFEAYEVWCLEVPRVLRRNATHHQWFEITNVRGVPVLWLFFGTNPRGRLAGNLVRQENHDWGVLDGYASVRTSNTRLQRTDVAAAKEEPALICFSEVSAEAGYGYFDGQILVREMRKFSGQWTAFDLTDWWSWWGVTERESATTTSKSAPIFDALMLRGRRLSN